jgi:putative transposase
MFIQELEKEVDQLCGDRYLHTQDQNHRWGSQKGSIVLGNQHVAVEKPRVRSAATGKEVRLKTYDDFRDPKLFEAQVFAEGLKKVSQRDYEKGLSTITNSFGFKKSSVSRKWINATAKKLEELKGRSLREIDIRAVFIDG